MIRLLIAISILILAIASMVFAAQDDFFQQQQIDIPGTVLGCRHGDLNGDGKVDLAVIVAEPSGARLLYIFLQREAGRFPPVAGQRIPLSPTVNQADCYDLNGDGKSEIFVVDHDGLWEFSYDGVKISEKPKQLIPLTTIFSGGIENSLLECPIVFSISGRRVVLLPTVNGYSAWEYAADKFRSLGEIGLTHRLGVEDRAAKMFGELSSSSFNLALPKIIIGDENTDRRDDIYFLWADRLIVVHQNQAGGFDGNDKIVYKFRPKADGSLCFAQVVDFDNNGRLDLITSKASGGIAGSHTDINLYTADRMARGDKAENQHVSLTDVCGSLMIGDYDRKGGLEVVVPAIELGIMSAVKKAISKETDVYILIYPINAAGQVDKEPTVRRKLTCRLDLEKPNPIASIRIDWSADYTGDGLPDLILTDGSGKLQMFPGTTTEYLESKPALVIDIPVPEFICPAELNGDKHSDLIIIHSPTDSTSRITLLVTNRVG